MSENLMPQSESKEVNLEKQRIKKLVKLFEGGLDNEKETIGYHGTSLESIEFLIKNGHLPGGAGKHVQKNDLYFFPAHQSVEDDKNEDTSSILERVKSYSNLISREHHLMEKLNLDLEDAELKMLARQVMLEVSTNDVRNNYSLLESYDELLEKLSKTGIEENQLKEAIKESKNREGVIIALKKTLLDKHTPVDAHPDDGHKVNLPDGLELEDICGLEPIGQEEWDYFEKLQKNKK